MSEKDASEAFRVWTRGLHHAAYLTKDMDATIEFYNGLLDMPLVVTLALPEPRTEKGDATLFRDDPVA